MAESVYKIIELVGTRTESWEKAAAAAVERASKSLRDLRIAEVAELDLQINNGKTSRNDREFRRELLAIAVEVEKTTTSWRARHQTPDREL